MKLATTVASAIALAALIAFSAHPTRAEDGAGPAPQGARGGRGGPGRRPPPGRGHGPLMAADANRDGAVSAKEWQDFLVKIQNEFTTLDKDGDGALSKAEMPAPSGKRGERAGRRGGRGRGPDGAEGRRGPPRGRGGPDGETGQRGGRGFGPPEGRGPDDRRGPPAGRGPRGPRGQGGQGGQGPAPSGSQGESLEDLRTRVARLTAVLEKLLAERKAAQVPETK